jgi:hypothetical protein
VEAKWVGGLYSSFFPGLCFPSPWLSLVLLPKNAWLATNWKSPKPLIEEKEFWPQLIPGNSLAQPTEISPVRIATRMQPRYRIGGR